MLSGFDSGFSTKGMSLEVYLPHYSPFAAPRAKATLEGGWSDFHQEGGRGDGKSSRMATNVDGTHHAQPG